MAIRKKIGEKLHRAKERIKKNKVGKTVVEKLGTAKREPRIPVLLIVDFFLSMVLVVATIVYLDPSVNLVPWPLNIILFLVILVVVVFLYNFSEPFRKEYREFFQIKKRW